jgi:hypothetical protein
MGKGVNTTSVKFAVGIESPDLFPESVLAKEVTPFDKPVPKRQRLRMSLVGGE